MPACHAIITDVIIIRLLGRLLELSQAEEPTDARGRDAGYPVDEQFIGAWTEAARQLLRDADAPLPLRRTTAT